MSVESALRDRPGACGFALIISNEYVGSSTLRELRGTREDAAAMRDAFASLNFAVLWKRNATREETVEAIYEASRSKRYPPKCLSIAFVFSGHGSGSKELLTQDEKTIKIDEIISPFFPRNASHIGSIPKLFFIDACRGGGRAEPVVVPKGVATCTAPGVRTRGASDESRFVAGESNYLVAYSTMPNHEAFEVEGKGGMWMTVLAKKLRSSRGSIEDVLTEVNEELLEKYQHGLIHIMQQPVKHSTLNEKVFLHQSGHGVGTGANEEPEEEKEKEEEEKEEDKENKLVPRDFSPYASPVPHYTKCTSMESTGSSCSLDLVSDSPVVQRAKKRTDHQSRGRRLRCGRCAGCRRTDCGECINCKDRPKFGGSGRRKKVCIHRRCSALAQQQSQDDSDGSTNGVIPGTSQKEQLEKYSLRSGRGKPVYSRTSTPGGKFVSTVRTSDCSHVSAGDAMESIVKAEESAAAKLLEKLRIQ